MPEEENSKPSSAFDVKTIHSNNAKAIGNYVTHIITKNEGELYCQLWNCSRKVSHLYTEAYSDKGILRSVEALERGGLLKGKRSVLTNEYCAVHTIPLNQATMRFYDCLGVKNKEV
ncbi:hypothetical protein SAMN05444008_105108 [Cnuella takakiae]|uniref:Uncharacterized protein n=1 Tax=Cnuella takakiae TaxID=1302690 RepID=A0A1M4Z6U7_9BACT|nr:hypothetical protein BUE76_22305 [Cnuella takakiae]SHF13668.1 hypothetical protein SAMN05444008_105108 [Cnuella takakiae]